MIYHAICALPVRIHFDVNKFIAQSEVRASRLMQVCCALKCSTKRRMEKPQEKARSLCSVNWYGVGGIGMLDTYTVENSGVSGT